MIKAFVFSLLVISFSFSAFAQKGFSAGINSGVNLSLTKLEYGEYNVPAHFRNRQMIGNNQALYLQYGFDDRLAIRLSVKRASLINAAGFYNVVIGYDSQGRVNEWHSSSFLAPRAPVHIDLTSRMRYPLSSRWHLTMGTGLGYMYIKYKNPADATRAILDREGKILIAADDITRRVRKHNLLVNTMLGLEWMTKRNNAFTLDLGFNVGINDIRETKLHIFYYGEYSKLKIRNKGDYVTLQLGYKLYLSKKKYNQ